MKITWKVAEAPTGRYKSFHKRGWPTASMGDKPVLSIHCDDSYTPAKAKSGEHAELKVNVAEWFTREGLAPSFNWRTLKQRFTSLDEAKKVATEWYLSHPNFWHPDFQPKDPA